VLEHLDPLLARVLQLAAEALVGDGALLELHRVGDGLDRRAVELLRLGLGRRRLVLRCRAGGGGGARRRRGFGIIALGFGLAADEQDRTQGHRKEERLHGRRNNPALASVSRISSVSDTISTGLT